MSSGTYRSSKTKDNLSNLRSRPVRHYGNQELSVGQQDRHRRGSAVEPEQPFEALGRQAGLCASLCRAWTDHSARCLWSCWRIAVALELGLGFFSTRPPPAGEPAFPAPPASDGRAGSRRPWPARRACRGEPGLWRSHSSAHVLWRSVMYRATASRATPRAVWRA